MSETIHPILTHILELCDPIVHQIYPKEHWGYGKTMCTLYNPTHEHRVTIQLEIETTSASIKCNCWGHYISHGYTSTEYNLSNPTTISDIVDYINTITKLQA